MISKLNEECGVFGISLKEPSSEIISKLYLGLFALQHRGQESCGIAYQNGESIELIKRPGLVSGVFFKSLPFDAVSRLGIGHVRYSTAGASNLTNAQPFVFNCNKGEIAIAHNGNIPNVNTIREELIQTGSIFQTSSDSEILVHILARISIKDFEISLISALNQINGAFSMLMIYKDNLIAFRDPFGFKPLCYGKIKDGYIFTSETNALDLVGAKYISEVEPGEIIFCKNGKLKKKKFAISSKITQCIFELIYFSRPDSIVFGESVHEVRIKMGGKLAHLRKVDTDMVIAIPDSGNSAALGFSRASGIPFELGLIRNHYTGRTFIRPGQDKREEGVKIKLNPIKSVINGKSIAVVDDSLVRGTTSTKIVKMLREAGAKEIHLFLSSPGIKFSCFFGIDTPTRKELISSHSTPAEIAKIIGADSVTFLRIEDLKECLKCPEKYCYACFDGNYSIPVE
ncbi:MAG: amidophosphoribosyltransferase [Spirochaetes bacterium]|nr:amidophosphoribosyltransferase [Spirochaetota bacterium]